MGMPVVAPSKYTISEYLEMERTSQEKHEYREGEVFLMAGGTYNHSLIVASVLREIGVALRGKPCRPSASDLRIRIPRTPLFTYPDGSVICGPPQFDPGDPIKGTVTNPRLIVEVLSPSTEAYDRGEKFTRYRQIESLTEYVLVSQDAARVETFFRHEEGTWLFTPTAGLDATILLRSLEISLPMREIYAGVEFPPPPPEPLPST